MFQDFGIICAYNRKAGPAITVGSGWRGGRPGAKKANFVVAAQTLPGRDPQQAGVLDCKTTENTSSLVYPHNSLNPFRMTTQLGLIR